jgi:hypothetical protein
MSIFADMVQAGRASTVSVNKELAHADDTMRNHDGARKYYGLDKAMKPLSTKTSNSLLSRVMQGDIDPAILGQLLPILSSVDPELVKFFTQGNGAKLLLLVSKSYTQGRLDLSLIETMVSSNSVSSAALKRVTLQYQNGGMRAVDIDDLQTIFTSFDFGPFIEDSKPIAELFAEIISSRTINQTMILKHLASLKRSRSEREKRLKMESELSLKDTELPETEKIIADEPEKNKYAESTVNTPPTTPKPNLETEEYENSPDLASNNDTH